MDGRARAARRHTGERDCGRHARGCARRRGRSRVGRACGDGCRGRAVSRRRRHAPERDRARSPPVRVVRLSPCRRPRPQREAGDAHRVRGAAACRAERGDRGAHGHESVAPPFARHPGLPRCASHSRRSRSARRAVLPESAFRRIPRRDGPPAPGGHGDSSVRPGALHSWAPIRCPSTARSSTRRGAGTGAMRPLRRSSASRTEAASPTRGAGARTVSRHRGTGCGAGVHPVEPRAGTARPRWSRRDRREPRTRHPSRQAPRGWMPRSTSSSPLSMADRCPSGEIHRNVWSLAMVEAAVESAQRGALLAFSDVFAAAHEAALAVAEPDVAARLRRAAPASP